MNFILIMSKLVQLSTLQRMLEFYCECTSKRRRFSQHIMLFQLRRPYKKTWHSNLFLWNVFRRSRRISVVNVTIICILFCITLHKLLIHRKNTAGISCWCILFITSNTLFNLYFAFKTTQYNFYLHCAQQHKFE